jgi:phenylacetic acid degradation operon negative regulatory protein
MRRGEDLAPPPVWTGHLLGLLAMLGIEAGLVRTSLSRLVSAGVLERDRRGRNTFYRLSGPSAAEFAAAAKRIYGREPSPLEGFLRIALIDRVDDRTAARACLETAGYRFLSATTALKPVRSEAIEMPLPPQAIRATAEADGEAAAAARALWRIDALQAGYADFIGRFGGTVETLPPDAAIAARVVLVHRMRRLVLRDPVLPLRALPADWAGDAARLLFADRLATLQQPSERWLDDQGFRGGMADAQAASE